MDSAVTPEVRHLANYIDGKSCPAISGKVYERFSPANGALIATWPESGAEDVDAAVKAARIAFEDGRWSKLTGAERGAVLRKTGDLIKENYRKLAVIEAQETGKAISQAYGEMNWASDLWDYAAGAARHIHGDTHSNVGETCLGLMLREPVGVVGLITAWNYPLLVLSQKLTYALAAGCTIVAKPSELTAGTTLALAELLAEAGLPAGVFNVVTGYGDPVGKRIAEHMDIQMLSFTGSTVTGRSVLAAASSNMKKVVLELGGKNPSIVFADANLDLAVDGVVKGVLYNAGEECCSGSRLLVQRSIAESFTQQVCEAMQRVAVGDPMVESNMMGALVDKKQYDKVMRYIELGKQEARLALGGGRVEGQNEAGFYVAPTVFADVPPDARIANEEIFGPVLSIIPFDTAEEAVRIANAIPYGLASAVWTKDLDTSIFVARNLRAGMVWVNTFMDMPTEVPFGGVKQSGFGRENGLYAIEEFSVQKTIVIRAAAGAERYVPG